MKANRLVLVAVLLSVTLFLMSSTAMAQAQVRIHGATTLEKAIKPKLADIEAKAKVKIELAGNGAGRGLEDLATGKADIAMFAGSVPTMAASINEKTPGAVKPDLLKEETIFVQRATVVTHPGVKVDKLTGDQIKKILTGEVKNWKDVGGQDLAIVVVTAPPVDGVRATVQDKLLKDAKYRADARVLQVQPDVLKAVAQLEGAVSVVSKAQAAATVKSIADDANIDVPYVLLTMKDAKPPIPETVAAIKELIK